jgi:hypothetical protein
VWSLGVIAYALLLNKIPFDSMTEADIRDALAPAAATWPPFQVVAPFPVGLPDALPALLQRCWHRDAAMRIRVTELACELAALDQTPLSEPLPIPAPDAGYESLSMFQLIRPALPPGTVVTIKNATFTADDALIHRFITEADSKCRSSQEILLLMTQRSVTLIEAQSIFIYTSELMYSDFTAAFRSQDAARIQRWSNFAHTLQSGLRKLEAPPPTFPKRPAVPEFTVV